MGESEKRKESDEGDGREDDIEKHKKINRREMEKRKKVMKETKGKLMREKKGGGK